VVNAANLVTTFLRHPVARLEIEAELTPAFKAFAAASLDHHGMRLVDHESKIEDPPSQNSCLPQNTYRTRSEQIVAQLR
jgi:hypothetical protein